MSSPPLDDDILIQSFSVSLTVYSKVKKVLLKGKTTSKEEKSTKMKELLFALDKLNYTKFLQAVLHKHGLDDYMVTKKKHFPLKYIPPKARGEMVQKIAEETPPVMKVFMDMPLGPIPLMPAMVHDWCLALEDGQATIAIPPNIESFNMANKVQVLHHACKMSTQAGPTPTADLNLLNLTLTPTQWHVAEDGDTPSFPPIPSPSQLSCYLQYAKSHLAFSQSWYHSR
ncbi:hypothetical protein EDC04DRAFT_2605909 [Pisolithus marmoratus]|nr:hypothetical protein EDC04DRAFT_2605909 [Pisolithus marmoratus]